MSREVRQIDESRDRLTQEQQERIASAPPLTPEVADKIRKLLFAGDQFPEAERKEHIYLVGSIGSANVKIGFSEDPQQRLKSLQSSSPVPLKLLWYTEAPRHLESHLHRAFRHLRKHGEWFDFGDADPVTMVSQEAIRYTGKPK
jgi:hypothetical protein